MDKETVLTKIQEVGLVRLYARRRPSKQERLQMRVSKAALQRLK